VKPIYDSNAHRLVLRDEQELDLIFSIHHKRKLSKNLSLQYNNTVYQLKIKGIGYAMRGAMITVCEAFDGTITLLYNGKEQHYETYKRGEKTARSQCKNNQPSRGPGYHQTKGRAQTKTGSPMAKTMSVYKEKPDIFTLRGLFFSD